MKKFISIKQFFVILIFVILTTMAYDVQKNTFINIELGQVIERDVTAQKTLTYVDEIETKKQKELAISNVQEVYEKNSEIKDALLESINNFFDSVILQKNEYAKLTSVTNIEQDSSTSKIYISNIENKFEFTEDELKRFFELSESTLRSMKGVFGKEIEKIYTSGITFDQLENTKNEFKNNSNFYFFDAISRDTFINKVSDSFEANMIFNNEETKNRLTEAEKQISDVSKTVKRGEIIMRKGDIVEENDLAVLAALGYTKSEISFLESIKRIPFVFVLFLIVHMFLIKYNHREIINHKLYLMVYIMFFLVISLNQFAQNEYVTYTLLLLTLMISVTFLNPRIAIVLAFVLGLLVNINDIRLLVSVLIMGIVLRLGYDQKASRSTLLNLGLITATSLIVVHLAMNSFLQVSGDFADVTLYVISPILAAVLTIGILPYLEVILGMVTPVKLHELTSQKHPLTKRIIDEIPGTYSHSLRVGQIGEAAADRIGANGLLVKVAAIFHDSGKLKNPKFFVENLTQGEENPHLKTTAEQSADIIRKHPVDSVVLCKKYNLPNQIIDMIERHHGDDLVNFFYIKALNERADENVVVDVEKFKYTTPLPETKEDGILMLADIAEASSRAFINESREVAKEKLTEIIYQKIEDRQLRNCELTIKEIDLIIDTFLQNLLPSAHTRPIYPTKK